MNQSRNRKIAYLLGIVGLFTALIFVSQALERSAERHKLAQKSLGNVNPVSGTAQLVLAGFRGVAVTFLWHEAIDLKKKERWFEIRPVIESISLLQPNFVKPWTFQAWNMAYNIAAEWEAVDDKYYWIRQGIDFMKEGTRVNRDKPDLEWYVGDIYFNKFGVSDEKKFLRQLLRQDPDKEFAAASSGIQDNFELAYDWFDAANEIVRRTRKRPLGMSITPFMYKTGLSRMYYAINLAEEGSFDEKTKNGWRAGHREWLRLGREGGPDRNRDLIRRLEFTPEEFAQLTGEQQEKTKMYRNVVKYEFWKHRSKVEATDEMQAARETFYQATEALSAAEFTRAIGLFERAFPQWRALLENDTTMREDDEIRDDCQTAEDRYLRLLSRLDMPLPEKRPFDGMYEPLAPTGPITGRDLERTNMPVPPSDLPKKDDSASGR